MEQFPRVGVGVLILREGKVLLGKRKGAHGEGSWSPPGGHLELNEAIEDCGKRETKEETDLEIKGIKLGPLTNDIFRKEGKHYITVFLLAEPGVGEVTLMEPNKCEKWDWFEWDHLPKPLFLPLQNLLKQNFNPFE